MSDSPVLRTNRPQWLDLHPVVPKLLMGSMIWLFLAVWIFFSHSSYTAFQLVIVAFFLVTFGTVPSVMARIARKQIASNEVSFREWRTGHLQTYTGLIPAGEAALMVLIVPAAAVVGVTAISAIAYLASIGAL